MLESIISLNLQFRACVYCVQDQLTSDLFISWWQNVTGSVACY